jgi:hypothetical protein
MIGLIPRAFGADPVQWRALVQASLRSDVRHLRGIVGRSSTSGVTSVAGALFSQLIYGGLCALFIVTMPDVFLSSTVYIVLLASTLGLALLVDFTGIVLSPDDHAILAHRPVDGRTFFAARLTSVVVYMWLLTAPFAVLPTLAYATRSNGSIAAAIASLAAAFTTATLVPVVAIVLFVSLMALIPPDRLQRGLGYLQFTLSFLFVGGFFLYSRSLRQLGQLQITKTPLAYLNPATWLVAWIELADGRGTGLDAMAAVLPVVAGAVLILVARGRLSLAYAEQLGARVTERRTAGQGHLPLQTLIAGPAHHAVSMLARAQFRVDQKFRLGVLGILPLTVIYLLAGFADTDGTTVLGREPVLVYYAVLFFPAMLRQFLVHSEAWRASWIFHAAPMPFDELVVGLKNTVVARFLIPYLAVVLLLLQWFVPRPWLELAVHGLVLGLLSHAVLVLDLWLNPALPFSQPTRQGARSFALLLLMLPVVGVITSMPLWQPYVYASTPRMFAALGLLVVVNVLLHEALLTRVARVGRQWRYAG